MDQKQRLYSRFSSRFPVKFKDMRQDFGMDVFLRNFSAEGARISSRQQVYLNDSVALEVKLPDGKQPVEMRGEVVWTKKIAMDTWDVGIKFHKVVFMDLWRIYKTVEDNTAI